VSDPDRWLLTPSDYALVMAKHQASRLAFAVLLVFFRTRGRFPRNTSEIDPTTVDGIAEQIRFEVPAGFTPVLSERTTERHRAEIRALLRFREATVADAEALESWLRDQLAALVETRCRELLIEPPSLDRINRIVRAAIRAHDDRFYAGIRDRLAPETRARLEALLHPADAGPNVTDQTSGVAPALLLRLRGSPGRPSLASIQNELALLELSRGIELPADLFDAVLPRDLERYRQRVAVEAPHELRRHPEAARLTWLAAFVILRGRTLTDDLVDLLIETVHRIGARAEHRVEREMLNDLKRVSGKPNLLFEIAGASIDKPDGTVREVVFPIAGEQTLRDQGAQCDRASLQDDAAHSNPQFLQGPLPAHGAPTSRKTGVSLEQ
jgi:hypothetical protein